MIIIPAIDLRSERVVRLTQGDFTTEKFYSSDPVEVAKRWRDCGAKLIHIVDLDGAIAGEPRNLHIAEKIKKDVKVDIQFGGGLRTDEIIERVLSKGIDKAIIGTRAYRDREFVERIVKKFKDKIIVSIDAAGRKVMAQAWTEPTSLDSVLTVKSMESLGIKTIIYTDVLKDGTLENIQVDAVSQILDAVKIDVIAAGGVSSIADIKKLKALKKKNLFGVIIGKAIYEGKVDLEEAIRIAKGK